LGFDEDGQARVVDGAGGVAKCTAEDVLARWDGIAIAVRKRDSPRTRYLSQEVAGLCLLIAYAGVFSLVVRSGILTRRDTTRSRWSTVRIHIAALLVAAIGLGYASKGQGFANAAKGIDSALGLGELPTVTVDELVSKMRSGAVLIDCRYKQDYDLGYIDGAISVPVDVGLGEFTRLVADIDRDAEVVVYCQSPGCGFSGLLATMLAGAGFRNVSVFKAGYEAWEAHVDGK
jgi:rhodanese-related sulfurtransferase